MDDELKKICLSEAKDLVSIDEAIEIYNQIKSEMIEYVNNGLSSSLELDAMQEQEILEKCDQEKLFENRIVCPVCQKQNLNVNGNIIECANAQSGSCEFKVDASKSDIRNQEELFARLQNVTQQHPCNEVPKFLFRFFDNSDNKNSLVIYCENCGFMQNIL